MRKHGNKLIILFFVGMLIMTVIARMMDSITIAKVQTNIPQKRNLTYHISCEGEAESQDIQYLKPEPGLVVEKLVVQTSQAVQVGDPLYRYDRKELADVTQEKQSELDRLILELQKQQLQAVPDQKIPESYLAEQELLLAQREMEIAQIDKDNASIDYEEKINKEQKEYDAALTKLDVAHGKALERIGKNKTEDGEENEDYEIEQEEENKSYEERKQTLKESHQSKQEALLAKAETYATKAKSAADALEKATITWQNAQISEQYKGTNQKRADQIASMDTAIAKITIEEKKQEVSRLQSLIINQGLITSPYEGIVTKSELQIGKTTTGEELLEIGTLECIFTCVLEAQDFKYLKNGDQGTIRFEGKEEVIDATIEAIEENIVTNAEANESQTVEKQKRLKVVMEGDSREYIGCRGCFTVNKQTQVYQTCIPITALCEDSEGIYCMKVQEENSVLGNTLTAVRVKVEILEKDSQFAAVSGELADKDNVITNANKSVKPGNRVRVIQHE